MPASRFPVLVVALAALAGTAVAHGGAEAAPGAILTAESAPSMAKADPGQSAPMPAGDQPKAAADSPASGSWMRASFTQGIAPEDGAAAGLAKLSADEVNFLNVVVAREMALARAGNVRGFAGTFIGRRTAEERAKAGLDRLNASEQARLNSLVAATLAAGPGRPEVMRSFGRNALDVVNRLQIHGEVSLTVGSSGHGRDFYGTSFYTTITDPESNLTIGLGYEQFHGNGWYGYGPDDYWYDDVGYRGHGFGAGGCVRHR